MKLSRRPGIAILLFLGALPLFAAPSFYRSNDFGMQLEPLPSWRRAETTWILEISRSAAGEVRRLLRDGKEVRRWETSRAADGHREEREYSSGVLAARRLYSPEGSLVEEDQYKDGKLQQKSVYSYAASRVSRVRVLGPDGALLYTQDYLYTSRGTLREVTRTGGGGAPETAWFVAGRSGLSEERERVGDAVYTSRYDTRGRAQERETRIGKDLISKESFTYHGDTDTLLSAVEERPGEGRTITRSYDEKGRLQAETVSAKGKFVEETDYNRDDKGRVTRKVRRSAAGLEVWKYTRDENGKVAREEYYNRGSLEKVTLYGADDTRTEELYQAGALFLKVYFQGDRRVREEVYVDGKVVRERKITE